ncbi:MAG: hypothetical protein J0L67_14575 [Cytophagales bacterium]|nr:hypothetical protein [Cytophagales bacterium]
MRRIVFIVLIGLILSCDTERNIPLLAEDTFLKFYGVEGEQTGVDFVLTADNAIVMVGNSNMPGGTQMIYVVKVDLLGNVIWENMIGLANKNNTVKDIELHPDGRLVIAGETEMAVNDRDIFLQTMSGDGNELESVTHGISIGSDEEVKSVSIIGTGIFANQQGFIVAGATTSIDTEGSYIPTPRDIRDAMHVRFTDLPSLQAMPAASWDTRTGKNDSEDVVVKIIRSSDPNLLYCFGYTNTVGGTASGDFKYWVFAINDAGEEAGDLEALFNLLGQASEDEILKSVLDVDISDPFDRGFLLNGVAIDNAGNRRGYFVKFRRDINFGATSLTDVTQAYNVSFGIGSDKMNGFYNPFNNDYLILGTQNSDRFEDLSLFKLDREIQPVWGPEVFGGESFDEAGAVLQLPDGKIMVLGTMTVSGLNGQKKMALMKLNDKGKLLR